MPRLDLTKAVRDDCDQLDKTIQTEVRRAINKFQRLSLAELRADKDLHLESVRDARDPKMRIIRITDSVRGVVRAPEDGNDAAMHHQQRDRRGRSTRRCRDRNTHATAREDRNAGIDSVVRQIFRHKAAPAGHRRSGATGGTGD